MTTEKLIDGILDYFKTDAATVTTAGIREYCEANGLASSTILNRLGNYRVSRGKYSLTRAQDVAALESAYQAPVTGSLVPVTDGNFVPFGNYSDVKNVLKSKLFYPLFITGLSGNGKTHSVEQACATLQRECVRVNITIETDEDDLIGGFRLVDGNTVWHDGPVVEALKRGAVLLLDEIDLASNKIMCLQSLLEGNGVYLKKINEYVKPAPGFNVVATANTKGKGDDSGNFIGTNILNEAFLERFAVTFQQDYPTPAVETKILSRVAESLSIDDPKFIVHLVTWAEIIRKTYDDGGVDAVITTRRLINILKAFAIWGNVTKSIELCTNRFDDETRKVFTELYTKVSGDYNDKPELDYIANPELNSEHELHNRF